MSANVFTSNGWDLIAAATQDALNAQLVKIPMLPVKATQQVAFLGTTITAQVDISIGAPQLRVRAGSGRQVDILLQVNGSVTLNTSVIPIAAGQKLIVTTDLVRLKAELQPEADKTTFDLVLNFESPDLLVDMQLQIPDAELAALVAVLKIALKHEIGNGKRYKVASFALSKTQVQDYKALIPYMADFSFVEDQQTPGRSNLLVLMQTVTKTAGNIYFNAPLLPTDQDFLVLMSNQLFLQYFVMPPLVTHIQSEAKDSGSVPGKIALQPLPTPFLYQLANTSDITLAKDHDPWIASATASIDPDQQALYFYLDAKADATFLEIHVDTWTKSWQQFEIGSGGAIGLNQTKDASGHSTGMEWWKWLLAVLSGGIGLLVTGIIYAVVEGNNPDLGGTFASIGKNLVTWPNQKTVVLKKITTPNHVVLSVEVHF